MSSLTGDPTTDRDGSVFPSNSVYCVIGDGREYYVTSEIRFIGISFEGDPRRHDAQQQATARLTLFSLLDAKQREEYSVNNYVTVLSQSGNRFRLFQREAYGVHRLDEHGRVTDEYCVAPSGADVMPWETMIASQILHLRFNEIGFLQKANGKTIYRKPPSLLARLWRWLDSF